MPSVNAKRQVRYTAADIQTIDGAVTLCEFVSDFDNSCGLNLDDLTQKLKQLVRHIGDKRAAADGKAAAK